MMDGFDGEFDLGVDMFKSWCEHRGLSFPTTKDALSDRVTGFLEVVTNEMDAYYAANTPDEEPVFSDPGHTRLKGVLSEDSQCSVCGVYNPTLDIVDVSPTQDGLGIRLCQDCTVGVAHIIYKVRGG